MDQCTNFHYDNSHQFRNTSWLPVWQLHRQIPSLLRCLAPITLPYVTMTNSKSKFRSSYVTNVKTGQNDYLKGVHSAFTKLEWLPNPTETLIYPSVWDKYYNVENYNFFRILSLRGYSVSITLPVQTGYHGLSKAQTVSPPPPQRTQPGSNTSSQGFSWLPLHHLNGHTLLRLGITETQHA